MIDSLIDCNVVTSVESHHSTQASYSERQQPGLTGPDDKHPVPAKLVKKVVAEEIGDINVDEHTHYETQKPVPVVDSHTVIYVGAMMIKHLHTSVTHFTML